MRLRWTRKGWVEPRPAFCSNGHRLGGGQVLVGVQHCECGRIHRSHTCRTCGDTIYDPPIGLDCRMRELDDR
jgi:hypothetical protein